MAGDAPPSSFSSFSHILDPRLLHAIADLGFGRPTPVQAQTIPLALDGRDVLARARTGSGKTAAYGVPLVQKILGAKSGPATSDAAAKSDLFEKQNQATRALILVPTRELAEQVTSFVRSLTKYCEKSVAVLNVAAGTTTHLERVMLSDKPDVVVGTPARILGLIQSKALVPTHIDTLVIDEADLILSYGHDEDMRAIFKSDQLPKVYQSILMSATLSEDVEVLKGLALRDPVVLKLEDSQDDMSRLSQYSVRCSEVDKFLLLYVILKLKLIQGKCIIFVNDVDRSYRVKLFLEQFHIKSCVLNSELPLNSRYHVVQEFNKGVYDYIIATDESGAIEGDETAERKEEEDTTAKEDEEEDFTSTQREPQNPAKDEDSSDDDQEEPPSPPSKSKKRKRAATPPPAPSSSRKNKRPKPSKNTGKEYGVTRGVDFIDVSCVLNLDLPTSARAYTHRVGRTARAGRTGMALSFVVPKEEWGKNRVVGGVESTRKDEEVWARIEGAERERAGVGSLEGIKEYKFDMKQVEAFRYRMEDALRSVTRKAIQEARVKELKAEILNSDKLKAHFEDNPLDLEYLRHDKPLHPTRVQPHMKHVPKYLLPRIVPVAGTADTEEPASTGKAGFVPFRKDTPGSRGRGRGRGRGGSRGGGRKKDPLRSFKA